MALLQSDFPLHFQYVSDCSDYSHFIYIPHLLIHSSLLIVSYDTICKRMLEPVGFTIPTIKLFSFSNSMPGSETLGHMAIYFAFFGFHAVFRYAEHSETSLVLQ